MFLHVFAILILISFVWFRKAVFKEQILQKYNIDFLTELWYDLTVGCLFIIKPAHAGELDVNGYRCYFHWASEGG